MGRLGESNKHPESTAKDVHPFPLPLYSALWKVVIIFDGAFSDAKSYGSMIAEIFISKAACYRFNHV